MTITDQPWLWLALVEDGEPPHVPVAAARVREGGWLAAWAEHRKPTRSALRVHRDAIDPDGGAARASFAVIPRELRPIYDAPEVIEARRNALRGRWPRVLSTLSGDSSHLGGWIVADGDDPFARLYPPRVLHVEAGLIGRMDAPAGPVLERYGSEMPWPWDAFLSANA